ARRREIQGLAEELEGIRREIDRLRKEYSLAEEELHRASLRRAQAQKGQGAGKLQELREERRRLYRELERVRASLAAKERELGEIQGKLLSLGEVAEPEEPIQGSPGSLRLRLREIEARLADLGPVNLRAIEEYEAYLTEFQAFKERVLTLEREKREIEEFIAEVEGKKRRRFQETLEAVSAELDRIFKVLFGGGEAKLSLESPGDLSSGLRIQVRLPGKELVLLDALSGGERALVAIAFVLALSAGRPAPFYILDEADAALDRPNSERLAGLLREIARDSQVIVVSHNEELVRHADRVYGVTLRAGASRVLALELVGNGR
ncbi:MAG TPA: hypothetical protein ENF77_02890, partial [Candidatus Acetothermia bacterium]|nr:hypothetical protein [Candidatus Acetothermia bacterium]